VNGTTVESSDCKSAVQEIVDRGGWASGNALALILADNAVGTNHLGAHPKEDGPGSWIRISYTPPGFTAPENVWVSTDTVPLDTGCLFFNDPPTAFGVKHNSLEGLTTQGDFYQPFYWPSVADHIFVYSTENPATYYSHIECSQRQLGGTVFFYQCSHITVRNLDIRHGGRHNVLFTGSVATPAANITLEHCDISYCGGSYEYDGAERGGSAIQVINSCHDITIRYNYINECWEDGFDLQANTNDTALAHIYVYENVFSKCAKGTEYWMNGSGITIDDLIISGNVFYGMGYNWGAAQRTQDDWEGWMLWGPEASPPTVTNSYVRNNIFHTCADHFIYAKELSRLQSMNPDYNCYWPTPPLTWGEDAAGPFSINYTTYDFAGWKTATGMDGHSIFGDPLFVDPANGDFRLQAGSPCIAAGVAVANIEQRAVPDIGLAYMEV
jgi:hypothetical protein